MLPTTKWCSPTHACKLLGWDNFNLQLHRAFFVRFWQHPHLQALAQQLAEQDPNIIFMHSSVL